ncbi:TonB family protein [Malaciobacter mytili]|uniref:energy transducer TonB n=1 Tax=Malaciobacter mytili TaxID=603050 RepID=UPI003BB1DEBC
MKRYINSFFITLFLYIVTIATFLSFDKKIIVNEKEDTKKLSLNYVEIKEEKKVVKEEVKKEEPLIKEQVVKKEQPKIQKKKEPIKKQVKKEEKKPLKKEPIKKEVVKQIKQPEEKKEVLKETKKENIVSKPALNQEKVYIDKNLLLIRKLIQENIVYSKRAKRFNIQGVVKVKFKILKEGGVAEVVILQGHKLLQKSTIEAINSASKSFPKVPKDLIITLPVEYKLI